MSDMEYYETEEDEEEDLGAPPCCQETYFNAQKEFDKREKKIKEDADKAIATIEEVFSGENEEIKALELMVESGNESRKNYIESIHNQKELSNALERAHDVIMDCSHQGHEWQMKFQAYKWALKELNDKGLYTYNEDYEEKRLKREGHIHE